MYRAILVDDEMASLRFLRNFMTSNFDQFLVAAEFESGLDALEYCRKNQVDLIITDVKMPIMNGIELARYVHEMRADTHIVVVSGYSEFEYAKGAIDACVDDYLLKPLSMTSLKTVLLKLLRVLDEEYANMRVQLLTRLIGGDQIPTSSIIRYFEKTSCMVTVMRLGNLNPRYGHSMPGGMPIPRDSLPDAMAILNGRDAHEYILIDLKGQKIQPSESSRSITTISDNRPCAYNALAVRIQTMFEQLDAQVVIGKNTAIKLQDTISSPLHRLTRGELKKIDHLIASANYDLIQQIFREWANEWTIAAMPQRWVEKEVHQIATHFLSQIPALYHQETQIDNAIYRAFLRADNLEMLMNDVWDALFSHLPTPNHGGRSPKSLYQQIEGYIRDNCTDPLTTQSVCSVMGISQPYLSKLFRKYGQSSFNRFLTDCRIELAKKLLLDAQSIRINDIAICVGYENQSYFCKVFRQHTGMTPGQYVERSTVNNQTDWRPT